ncbi:hypothetical protein JW823_00270 [bacterium]|nr:hypothetical protein [candidate division CSSED10-310 bacterium]
MKNDPANSPLVVPRKSGKIVSFTSLFSGWILAYSDIHHGLILPFQRVDDRLKSLAILVSSIGLTWFIYVPIHELLHVGGCVITGGTVSELILGREYGADLLRHIFPFITPITTQYAGRVTGFQPNGDIGYLVTVFAPFILTVFPGVWFIGKALQTAKIWFWGPGIVMGLASFYNLTGDFFEIGTIFSTRLLDFVSLGFSSEVIPSFWELRSDDVFRLFSEIASAPDAYGMNHFTGMSIVTATILIGFFLAVVCSGLTYRLGRRFAGIPMIQKSVTEK